MPSTQHMPHPDTLLSHRGSRQPESVDVVLGRRIRDRRVQRGMAQSELAGLVGITYQQLQKYERGANRISASRLYAIAQCLDLSIAGLFDAIDPAEHAPQDVIPNDRSALELNRLYASITDPTIRRGILKMLREVAKDPIDDRPGAND